ncbi:MAG: DUF1622 domain-containing protein [bacterium]
MEIQQLITFAGSVIEILGISVIFIGVLICTFRFIYRLGRQPFKSIYVSTRNYLGQTLLLGLEVLMAADIVRSITGTPNLQSILILGLIVLIRTFLSMALNIELEGRLPWKKAEK